MVWTVEMNNGKLAQHKIKGNCGKLHLTTRRMNVFGDCFNQDSSYSELRKPGSPVPIERGPNYPYFQPGLRKD